MSQHLSATKILDQTTMLPHPPSMGIMSLNSDWIMRKVIAQCARKMVQIGGESHYCDHDECIAVCWCC